LSSKLVNDLRDIVGDAGIVGPEAIARRATSFWDTSPMQGKLLVRPDSTEAVSAVLETCHALGQPVVVQGGLTGPVEGAVGTPDDVLVSLERMASIEFVDDVEGVAIVQAGAVLETVQNKLAEKGFLFPLDLGARGSCTIGGTVATNAGGINVLRYGMARNLVLGLEAVLPDGTVISSMQQMLKNNAGYDLKQLFIGSEGTLGIVTRVAVRLFPLPTSRQTVLAAADSFDAVITFLNQLKAGMPGTLSAFEVMWNNYYRDVTGDNGQRAPLGRDYPYYIIAEAEGADEEADAAQFEKLLSAAFDDGLLEDAVVAKSGADRQSLWAVREGFETILPAYIYDVSLPIRYMTTYADRLNARLQDQWPGAAAYIFGHIADGNLHIFTTPHDDGKHRELSDAIVYGCLDGLDGSVSAEHGIGLEKRAWLPASRSEAELALMRTLKTTLDPQNILNPGKILI
jgi:FAD/FMN-containing dehydrogenase